MRTLFVIAAMAATFLGSCSASAQLSGMAASPLGTTSPLAMSPGLPVAPTGIALGATELTTPGISPGPASAMGVMGCPSAAGSTSSSPSPLFDGGGMAAVSGACLGTGAAGSAMPAQSTSRIGPAGIPLGSTELGSGGLSPAPPLSTMFVSPIVPSGVSPLSTTAAAPSMGAAPPCPVTGTFPDGVTARQVRSSDATDSSGC